MPRLIASPPPVDAATAVNNGNIFIDWLHLQDADGGVVSKYTLMLDQSMWHSIQQAFFGKPSEILHYVSIVIGAFAAAVIDLIANPHKWLTPLSSLYKQATSIVYTAVPPQYIVIASFAVLLALVYHKRATSTRGQLRRAQWNRIGSALVLVGVIAVIVSNPFALIQQVLDFELAIASGLTSTAHQGGVGAVVNTSGVDVLRDMTWLINYEDILSPECGKIWSENINTVAQNPACLTEKQLAATNPNPQTLVIAVTFLLVALAYFKFAFVAGKLLFNEIGLGIAYLVGAVYPAALSLGRRRPYDPLLRCLARAAAHGVMAMIFLAVVLIIPGAFIKIVHDFTGVPVFIQTILIAAGYHFFADALHALTKHRETLRGLFAARIEGSQFWGNVFPGGGSRTSVLSSTVSDALESPTRWLRDMQRSLTKFVDKVINQGVSPAAVTTPFAAVNSDVIDAATSNVKLYEPQTATRDTAPPPSGGGDTFISEPPDAATDDVVAVIHDGEIVAARPAKRNDPAPPDDSNTSVDIAERVVWFRGGLPQFAPPQLTYTPLSALTPPQPVAEIEAAPEHRSFAERMRADAAALHGLTTTQTADPTAVFATHTPPTRVSVEQQHSEPKDILATADWMHRLTHWRNLRLAKGIETPIVLSAADERTMRIRFVCDADGNNSVEQTGLSFGDII